MLELMKEWFEFFNKMYKLFVDCINIMTDTLSYARFQLSDKYSKVPLVQKSSSECTIISDTDVWLYDCFR